MNPRALRLLAVLLPLLLLGAGWLEPRASVAGAAPPSDSARKIEPDLLKQLLSAKNGRVPFVAHFAARADLSVLPTGGRGPQRAALVSALKATADRAQVHARALLAARAADGRAGPVRPFWVTNALASEADRDTIYALAALPEVSLVRADHVRRLIDGVLVAADDAPADRPAASAVEWNIQQIGADRVWNAFGIDGTGVVVANMDTGVDWQHPALLTRYRGYRGAGPAVHDGNWFDATGYGYVYPGDGYGHGTHTMGTLVGGAPGDAIGVAPGAKWIATKIFDNSGRALDSWIHSGFQWIIAPAGDPALAPDIVSNSWGTDNGFDTVFQDDVRAVRAAGILQFFANGNNGAMGAGSVGAPASYPESFGVGATDAADQVAYFSSRGPSPIDGAIKPDASAPGVNVRSSVPGGGYRLMSGTSMATPHVAGEAALLRQARPDLTLTDTIYLITSTALPLTASAPNNDSGWGRVDAYQAILRVTAYGTLSGTISADGAPLAGAQVVATDHLSRTAQATSGSDGSYQLPLAPDSYKVSVFAYGFAPSLNTPLVISTAQTTAFDAALTRLPSGIVRGRITDATSSAPLSATVAALGTPALVSTTADGAYSLTLPVGAYTLRAAAWAHRALTATVDVTTDALITADFALPAAPTVLLVDSGAWYFDSQIQPYRDALDALGYPYALHSVSNPLNGAPAAAEMRAYSITLWSAPQDSPDYIDAGPALIDYLDHGGRLLLSGQDIAFWDAGPGGIGYDYFPGRLHGAFVADQVNAATVSGVNGEALQGITFTVNTTDSARNQTSMDAVQPLDEFARSLARYATGDIGGLAVGICVPYRAAYLAFGFEGVGPADVRQNAMQGMLNWLTASPPVHGLYMNNDPTVAVGTPGVTVTHIITLRNTGLVTDAFALTVNGNAWSTTLWGPAGGPPLVSPLTLGSCEARGVELRTAIPGNTGRNTSDTAAFVAQSQADAPVIQTRTLTSKTPAPLLLVDDDRWYEQEQKYFDALAAAGIAYDVFDTRGGAGPPTARMQMYPVVVWFNGYDWFDPLNGADEAAIAAYLNSGGRLFYSAQDYLDVRYGKSDFAPGYLGVLTYTNDVTITRVGGLRDSPISDGLGPYTLTFPYFNWSDYVTPTLTATAAYLGNGRQPSALTVRQPQGVWKTVYFAFPFETLPAADRPAVLGRIAGWLGPLGDSALIAPSSVVTGAAFTYRLDLTTSNPAFASGARVTVTLPASVTLLTLGDPSLLYDAPSHSIRWSGTVTSAPPLTWTVQLDPAAGDPFAAQYEVADTDEGFVLVRRAWTFVERARLYLPFIGQ